MIFGCGVVQLSGRQNNAWEFRVLHCIRIVLCLQAEPCPVGIAFSALANDIGGGQKVSGVQLHSRLTGPALEQNPAGTAVCPCTQTIRLLFQQIVVVIARTVFQMDVFLMQPFSNLCRFPKVKRSAFLAVKRNDSSGRQTSRIIFCKAVRKNLEVLPLNTFAVLTIQIEIRMVGQIDDGVLGL